MFIELQNCSLRCQKVGIEVRISETTVIMQTLWLLSTSLRHYAIGHPATKEEDCLPDCRNHLETIQQISHIVCNILRIHLPKIGLFVEDREHFRSLAVMTGALARFTTNVDQARKSPASFA